MKTKEILKSHEVVLSDADAEVISNLIGAGGLPSLSGAAGEALAESLEAATVVPASKLPPTVASLNSVVEYVELQGGTVVLGIPLASPHALLADKLRARRGEVQDALKRLTGRDLVIDWTEVRSPARDAGPEPTEKERVRREVEQLPIFQQVQAEFGATLRLGDERR